MNSINTALGNTTDRIRAALECIQPDDRETWLRMGMAVKSELGDDGHAVWDSWSQGAESYNSTDARDVWRSIKPNGGVTIASLFHTARQHGWQDDTPPRDLSAENIAERKRSQAERVEKEAAAIERERAETAAKAAALWEKARPVEPEPGNPYLTRKGVRPTETLREIEADQAASVLGYRPKVGGEPLTGPLLVVPVQVDGRLSSLELIAGDGRKAALRGRGTRAGGYWASCRLPRGDGDGTTLVIGEGVATVLTASEATKHPAVAALSASNLPKVAKAIRDRYPAATLVVLADLKKKTGETDHNAIKASRMVGGVLAVPDFGQDRPEGATDMNDLAAAQGPQAVRQAIEGAVAAMAAADTSDADGAAATERDTEPKGALRDDLGRKIQAPEGWKLTSNAVFEVKEKKEDIDYLPLCGPLWVVGLTNGAHGEWGMVLAFLDRDGCAHRLAIPASRLHEDSTILARELASLGLRTVPGREKRLVAYVATWEVKARILSAKRLGWLEDPAGALSFVMPDRVIANGGTREVVFQPDRYSPTVRTVHAAGSLDEWKRLIAAPASRHPPMLFALSAGLAPALLAFAEAGDSFLVHFWGSTSRGKTTLGQIAASPWGCAADPNDAPSLTFVRRWNVTGNGLEGLAEAHSDLPLVLDELGAATIGDIRPLVYQVSSGQGKTALNSSRELKEPRSWRTIVVSTGELSIHARMSDPDGDGTRLRTVKGGLTHRALDIEISDIAAAIPAAEREALVSGIKVACAHHYGTAGPELVRLIADRFATAAEARVYVREQVAVVTADIAPHRLAAETLRAVRRFALIAVAGELAVELGQIPATTDQVRQAAREVVSHWLGAAAETDEQRIVASVRAFLLKHESRFQRTTDSDVVQNRVGFVDRADGRWMFTDAGLIEAAPGYDRTSIARALRKAGYLHTNSDKLTVPVTVDGRRTRLYVIKAGIFENEEKSALSAETGVQGVHGVSAQQPRGFEGAHPPENQGVQGVQQPHQGATGAHPAHPDEESGVHPPSRPMTGLAHHAHPGHRNIGVGGWCAQTKGLDEEAF